MSIINQNSSAFAPIIGNDEFVKSSPNLRINPSVSVISNVVDMIAQKVEMECELSKKPFSPELVIKMYDKVKQDKNNGTLFEKLDDVSKKLGANILNVFNTIQYEVKPTVDKLQSEILAMTNKILGDDEVVDDEGNSTVEVVDENTEEVIEEAGGSEEAEECFKSATKMNSGFDSVVRLYLDKKLEVESITPDEVGEETIKESITNIDTESQIKEDAATEAWNLISNSYNLRKFMYELCADSAKNGNYFKCVTNIKHAVNVVKPALLAWKKTFVNTTDKINEKIHANIDKALTVITTGLYTLNQINKIYKDKNTIVLTVDDKKILVNRENMKANNLTNDDVVKHLRVKYFSSHRNIPSTGISAREILSSKEKVSKTYEADLNTRKLRALSNRHSAMASAMKSVLTTYLENTDPTKLPNGVDGKLFAKHNASIINSFAKRLESKNDTNLQSSIFDFVIDMWHRNTPVAKAHKLFGQEVVNHLKLEPSMEDMHIKMIDTSVAVDIATDFIVDKLCVIDK